ncbi:MAG: 4-hydroxy-tetrahydrodipicolinate reductase [Gemmataceae bacterium]
MKTKLAINGAAGRMGQRLVALGMEDPALEIVAALEAAGHPKIGQDAGELAGAGRLGVAIQPDIPVTHRVDAVIDFSSPEGTMAVLPTCVDRRIPLVLATTGHTPEQKREIEAAAHHTAVLMAPNMSLVVNVLFALVRQAGMMLRGKDFDVEIIEQHHRFKKDAPSGTALHFARIIQEAMGAGDIRHGREGLTGERSRQEIGMHALRAGDNVGEHTILFSTLGEGLELVHRGRSRDSYARGALLAARYLADKGPGRYSMADVLGI